jgi:hypothetical protein
VPARYDAGIADHSRAGKERAFLPVLKGEVSGAEIPMMAAHPKSERDDLSTEQRRRILVALERIKK